MNLLDGRRHLEERRTEQNLETSLLNRNNEYFLLEKATYRYIATVVFSDQLVFHLDLTTPVL